MGKKFTKIPTDTFSKIQMNAGILLKGSNAFDPETGEIISDLIIGATNGGINATCVPSFVDFGENIDNCPKNTKELMQISGWDCRISGTFVTVNVSSVKMMLAAADIDSYNANKVTPRNVLEASDFSDIWYVGDYSQNNSQQNGGFVAIHLLNALSSGGFSFKSADNEKGLFTAEFTGHVSIAAQDVVPMEFYIKVGSDE